MILDDIVKSKRIEIDRSEKAKPLSELKAAVAKMAPRFRTFGTALTGKSPVAVIAQVKKQSPSNGILRENFDPVAIAKAYERAGASALSVLTDGPFFGGSPDFLSAIKRSVNLPVLRKDFILTDYQVYETRLMGADALLLIAAILEPAELKNLFLLSERLGMDCLVEIHDDADAEKTLALRPSLVGINNRDLRTFQVELKTTEKLVKRFLPTSLVVSESGIQKPQDLLYLRQLGVKAVLVGETLMKAPDVEMALRSLLGTAS